MVELTIFLLMILPGVLLALRGSSYLVDYAILVFVFNREVRRLVDFCNQQFNGFSAISLTPLLILALLFASFISRFSVLHPKVKQIFWLLLAAITYGFLVGILRNGVACIYQGAQYLSTIGLMGYAAVSPADDKTADRWLKTAAFAGVIAAIYGWYQYFAIPDWDAFWVRSVGFVGYLGKLESTQMSVFSTFSDRGVCSVYMALVAIPVLVSRRWRVFFGWPAVILLLSCVFLTMARNGIIVALLGAVLFPLLNGGKHAGRIIVIAAVVCAAFFAFSSKIPGADRIIQRFESLLHLTDDGSFSGRFVIAKDTGAFALANPLGVGIGSSGLAGKLNGEDTIGVATDNGWLEIVTSLGLPGFALFIAALVLLWRYFSLIGRLGIRDDYLGLARAFLIASLVFTWVGNFFIEFSVMWIAIGRVLSPMMVGNLILDLREEAESEAAEAVSGRA
jgi:putative inorganic carbon (hco3(-)) transporter